MTDSSWNRKWNS